MDLSHVSWVVLDEADRMLDRGFENDIREIIKACLPLPSSPLGPIGSAGSAEVPVARMVSPPFVLANQLLIRSSRHACSQLLGP